MEDGSNCPGVFPWHPRGDEDGGEIRWKREEGRWKQLQDPRQPCMRMEEGRAKLHRVQMEDGRKDEKPKKLFRNTYRFYAKRQITSRKSRILYSSPVTVPP
jgi:hypothetical protein